jgi:hypothetical protein
LINASVPVETAALKTSLRVNESFIYKSSSLPSRAIAAVNHGGG